MTIIYAINKSISSRSFLLLTLFIIITIIIVFCHKNINIDVLFQQIFKYIVLYY